MSVGDVVLLKQGRPPVAGQVVLHAGVLAAGHEPLYITVLRRWTFVREHGRCFEWQRDDDAAPCAEIVRTEDIRCALIWAGGVGNAARTLKPVRQ